MTLRGRLTTAFLAVVLGPVLLGAFFVAGTVAAVERHRVTERLGLAANVTRTAVAALCQQLHAAGDTVALTRDPADRVAAASQLVNRGVVGAVTIVDAAGRITYATPATPPGPWADCGSGPAASSPRALAARVELQNPAGGTLGTVVAAYPVDSGFISRLAATTGAAVSLVDESSGALVVAHTTEVGAAEEAVPVVAAGLEGERVGEIPGGRYLRRVGPSPGQPLPLLLSVPGNQPSLLYAVLVAAVVLAGLLAVLAAWRLARSTTRPLAELARAVDRVAQGDLAARVPVRAQDEVGQLASTFNRMTRETQSYVQALTSSRDQLRGHLAVLGDTLASTHDLPRILQVILRSALTATGARAGLVLLVDPGTGTLVGQCAEGLEGRWPMLSTPRPTSRALPAGPSSPSPTAGETSTRTGGGSPAPTAGEPAGDGPPPVQTGPQDLRVPVGTGVLGTVAATGEPQRGRVTGGTGLVPSSYEPRCETYVAVPFAAPNGLVGDATGPTHRSTGTGTGPAALGVLALYDRLGGDEFDDTDLLTLRTFAGHAAVAVENVRVHEEVQRLSLTDPLTGLWNYRYLKESIRREVERANRFGRMLSVLVLDLDRFKDVNDTYGHAAGDTVLAEFATRIRGEIREVDLAFRQGGEEFVVLLPETDARGATIVAERLGAVVRDTPILIDPHPGAPVPSEPTTVTITVSVGIAVYPDHATNGQQVLDAADDALYAAKTGGRDTYRVAGGARTQEVGPPSVPDSPDDAVEGRNGPVPTLPGGASYGPHPPRQSRGR